MKVDQLKSMIESLIQELRQTITEDVSIKITPEIDIEIRPEDNRILIGAKDKGWTTVNYTHDGLDVKTLTRDGEYTLIDQSYCIYDLQAD